LPVAIAVLADEGDDGVREEEVEAAGDKGGDE